MHISAMLTSLPLDFAAALRQVQALGFTHVDVVALRERPPEHLEALAETELLVSCTPLGRDLPEGLTLDAPDADLVREAVSLVEEQIIDAARLGATHAYLVPGLSRSQTALQRFAEAVRSLAEYAASRQVQLCIEHIPSRALSTVTGTLRWLEDFDLQGVQLLLDVGHCLISEEDPAQSINLAGERLGYVHFDDNDGLGDLHWPLLAGKLTEEKLTEVVETLQRSGYRGNVALELNAQNPDPVEALRDGRELLLERLSGPK